MTFDVSAANLHRHKRAAKANQEDVLGDWEQSLERLYGPAYRQWKYPGEPEIENHGFSLLSLLAPQLIFGNPRVRVKTSRLGQRYKEMALAHQFGLNRFIRKTKMRRMNERLASDFIVRWFVAWTGVGPAPALKDNEDPGNWPIVKRLSPRRFIWDPDALDPEEWAFMAHLELRDKDDMLEEAESQDGKGWGDWDLEAVSSLREYNKGDRDKETGQTYREFVPRGQVAYWTFYVPGFHLKEGNPWGVPPSPGPSKGYYGTLFRLADEEGTSGEGAGGHLCNPKPYWGHPGGPYTVAGAWYVSDQGAPLSPTVATKFQAQTLNDHTRAMVSSAADYKRFVLISDADEELPRIIKESDHHGVYTVNIDDLRNKVVDMEKGGITQQHVAIREVLKELLQENSGITEAMRGSVTGKGLATEHALAAQGSSTRWGQLIHKYRDGIQDILEKVSWILAREDSVVMDIDEEMIQEMLAEQGIQLPQLEQALEAQGGSLEDLRWRGGLDPDATEEDADALDLEIEPYSMEKTNEALQQARSALMDQTILMVSQLGPASLFIDVKRWLEMRGEFLNIPMLGEIVDTEKQRLLALLQLQLGMMPPPEGEQKPQPRLQRDVSPLSGGNGRPAPRKAPQMDGKLPGMEMGSNVGRGTKP